jgi:hypothetical protein
MSGPVDAVEIRRAGAACEGCGALRSRESVRVRDRDGEPVVFWLCEPCRTGDPHLTSESVWALA